MADIGVTTIRPEHFAALEQLQRDCYPTLDDAELMKAHHFASQWRVFAEGQIVAVDGTRVVGQGSGFFTEFNFDRPAHTFREFCDEFYFRNHDPDGPYYYGADMSVHPDYRGRGIGKLIYRARMDLCRRTNRRGIVAGGLIPGYAAHKQVLSPQEYVARVVRGELSDPTLTFQLKVGFRVRGMIRDYLTDSASDNWATLIEWTNPEYVESP